MAKTELPTVSLHNYGGGKVNHVKRGPFSHELDLQAEKNRAVPLLIGTNYLQSLLGFQIVQCGPENLNWLKQEQVLQH